MDFSRLQFEFGKVEFKDPEENVKGEEKVAQSETSAGSGWNSKNWGAGGAVVLMTVSSHNQGPSLAGEPTEQAGSPEEKQGRKPRMNKLYAPDSVNLRSESCFGPR